ncbi:MAG: hypothetical protein KR126chlam4_00979 [Candidatus Anoxychlamydiales bacterium]|nr:hypothetical protein [Candidatus Anoxychlamydiales bacterium]
MLNLSKNQVRTYWLIGLLIMYSFNFILIFLSLKQFLNSSINSYIKYISIVWTISINCIFLYAYYYCAYKKSGRKLLGFLLITTPLFILWGILSKYYLSTELYGNINNHNSFFWTVFTLDKIFFIPFYILSIKLLKQNKRSKESSKPSANIKFISENKIRQFWFYFLILTFILNIITSITIRTTWFRSPAIASHYQIFGSLFLLSSIYFLSYLFAYRKYGRKFLGLLLILNPFAICYTIGLLIVIRKEQLNGVFFQIFLLFFICIKIVSYVLNIKLFRFNKKIKARLNPIIEK